MKKMIFLMMFLLLGSGIALADKGKTITSNDSAIVKLKSVFGGFDCQIIYKKGSEIPKALEKEIPGGGTLVEPANAFGKLYQTLSSYIISFLDKDGFEVCSESSSLNFTDENGDLVSRFRSSCSFVYNKIASAVITYH